MKKTPTSPRSALPPCMCAVGKPRQFRRGTLTADKKTLFFGWEETGTGEEDVELPMSQVVGVYVAKKEGPFVVLACAGEAKGERKEIALFPESTMPNVAETLKEHLACLVSVLSGRSVEQLLQQPEDEVVATGAEEEEEEKKPRLLDKIRSPRLGEFIKGHLTSPRDSSIDTGPTSPRVQSPRENNVASPRLLVRKNRAASKADVSPPAPMQRPQAIPVVTFADPPMSMVGYLWKWGESTWKRKYFKLITGGQLVSYDSEEASRAKGSVGTGFVDVNMMVKAQTKGAVQFEGPVEFDGKTLWTFEITLANGHQWLLGAESAEKCIVWLKCITSMARHAATEVKESPSKVSLSESSRSLLVKPAPVVTEADEDEEVVAQTYEFQRTYDISEDSTQLLDRLGTTLASFDAEVAEIVASIPPDTEQARLLKHLQAVLLPDDEDFYDESAVLSTSSRDRSSTSSQIEKALAALEEDIFGDLSEKDLEVAVRATIEEHVGARGENRAEVAARLKNRIVSMRLEKTTPSRTSLDYDVDNLPPLPEVAPSIHEHAAYREYMRLRRAHDRKRREASGGGAWMRANLSDSSTAVSSPLPKPRNPSNASSSPGPVRRGSNSAIVTGIESPQPVGRRPSNSAITVDSTGSLLRNSNNAPTTEAPKAPVVGGRRTSNSAITVDLQGSSGSITPSPTRNSTNSEPESPSAPLRRKKAGQGAPSPMVLAVSSSSLAPARGSTMEVARAHVDSSSTVSDADVSALAADLTGRGSKRTGSGGPSTPVTQRRPPPPASMVPPIPPGAQPALTRQGSSAGLAPSADALRKSPRDGSGALAAAALTRQASSNSFSSRENSGTPLTRQASSNSFSSDSTSVLRKSPRGDSGGLPVAPSSPPTAARKADHHRRMDSGSAAAAPNSPSAPARKSDGPTTAAPKPPARNPQPKPKEDEKT